MNDVVTLHTQRLTEPASSGYLDLSRRCVRAARLNKTFPDRRRMIGTLQALGTSVHHGLYDEIYLDSRSGLPNMASFTRVVTDKLVGSEALETYASQADLDARSGEAEIYERQAAKRRYFERLGKLRVAPVDEHRVLLRRHEPEESRASFRVELTKLGGDGTYIRVMIELTQTSGLWAHKLVELDGFGEVAHGTEALRGLVYRFATYDAETLFVRLHELEGMKVERVTRGIVGPWYFALPSAHASAGIAEPDAGPLREAWRAVLDARSDDEPAMIASFATDIAAADVREERSNDPLSPLLASSITDKERARYRILRERHPFAVYKDRKFVATKNAAPFVGAVCDAAGTKNLVYNLR